MGKLAALALPLLASLGVHATAAWLVPEVEPRPRPKPQVKVTVAKPRRPPEPKVLPPPPPSPAPPPPVAAARVPERPRRATPRPEAPTPPPPPPQGFSVDESKTVHDGEGIDVAARAGGGNMFADPTDGLPPGTAQAVAPPPLPPPPVPPPPPARVDPPEWITAAGDRSPPYPRSALRTEVQGQVVLRVCVGPRGTVDTVQVVKGLGAGCDEAAVAWAKEKWRFRPARRGDRPVTMCILQPVRFELNR